MSYSHENICRIPADLSVCDSYLDPSSHQLHYEQPQEPNLAAVGSRVITLCRQNIPSCHLWVWFINNQGSHLWNVREAPKVVGAVFPNFPVGRVGLLFILAQNLFNFLDCALRGISTHSYRTLGRKNPKTKSGIETSAFVC